MGLFPSHSNTFISHNPSPSQSLSCIINFAVLIEAGSAANPNIPTVLPAYHPLSGVSPCGWLVHTIRFTLSTSWIESAVRRSRVFNSMPIISELIANSGVHIEYMTIHFILNLSILWYTTQRLSILYITSTWTIVWIVKTVKKILFENQGFKT